MDIVFKKLALTPSLLAQMLMERSRQEVARFATIEVLAPVAVYRYRIYATKSTTESVD